MDFLMQTLKTNFNVVGNNLLVKQVFIKSYLVLVIQMS
jgi:hypothetical protein